jgi:hypothetical protein
MGVRRVLALCGVVAAAILAVSVVSRNGAPGGHDFPVVVQRYYRANDTVNQVGAVLVLIAAVLLVLFAARLRELLRSGDRDAGMLAMAAFGGAVLTSSTVALAAVIHLALVSAANDHLPIVVRTLNVLDHYAFVAVGVGLATLLLAAGISTVYRPVLPRALGWIACVTAILAVAGPLIPAGILLGAIWLLLVGLMLLVRGDVQVGAAA